MRDQDSFGWDEYPADSSPATDTRTPPASERKPRGATELPSSASGRLLPPGPSQSESGRIQWGPEFASPAGWHPSHYVIELDDANFERQVLASGIPVVVDFWAEHCVPCRRQEESLQQLGQELFGRVRVGRLNVYLNPETTKRYEIKGVPHLMIVREGEVLQELVGDHSLEDLIAVLAKLGIE
ncbi:MAG: thioredoxin family protein [Planctomycetes bacterium]|nr:thioredoxin family protein [Planctomycetota bacterium]